MKRRTPNIVIISALTLITILLWISVGVYEILTGEPEEVIVEEEVLNPLDPNLDVQTLNSINSKVYIPESQASQLVDTIVATEESEGEKPQSLPSTPSPTPTPFEESESTEQEEGL